MKEDKVSRVLSLYSQLMEGRIIKKSVAAQKYGVNERSIQRDIEDIRAFCRNCMALGDSMPGDLIYDYIEKGYRLDRRQTPKLSNSESWLYARFCSTVGLSSKQKWRICCTRSSPAVCPNRIRL